MTASSPQRPLIVVGVDGSESSRLALRWAARIARAEDARIDVLGAWEWPSTYSWTALPGEYSPKEDTEKVLTEVVDEVFQEERPADLRIGVLEGDPARLLIELSKQALLVVVGSRGHGGFAGLLLGSVSAKVAELAKCPVLIAHGADPTAAEALAGRGQSRGGDRHGGAGWVSDLPRFYPRRDIRIVGDADSMFSAGVA
jgi:nucleotide-binding universal stress UspA family protein